MKSKRLLSQTSRRSCGFCLVWRKQWEKSTDVLRKSSDRIPAPLPPRSGFASRADRLYLMMMMMRRASLPFLSRFHSRSELQTEPRRLRFLSSPEIHASAPYPWWRHAGHGIRLTRMGLTRKKVWTIWFVIAMYCLAIFEPLALFPLHMFCYICISKQKKKKVWTLPNKCVLLNRFNEIYFTLIHQYYAVKTCIVSKFNSSIFMSRKQSWIFLALCSYKKTLARHLSVLCQFQGLWAFL